MSVVAHPEPGSGNKGLVAILLACGLLLGVSLWLGQQLLQQRDSDARLFAPQPCDPEQLQQGCSALNGKQQIRFFIDSDEINSHAPLALRVDLQGFDAQQVDVELQGVDMYMGELRVSLERGSDNQFRAQGQLPACTTGTMTWRARVWITDTDGRSGSWFDFTAR
ncbi:MAG: hypothetical protein ACJAWL_003290 [Motiliproteus sp.]|jgi:hypothetical protein